MRGAAFLAPLSVMAQGVREETKSKEGSFAALWMTTKSNGESHGGAFVLRCHPERSATLFVARSRRIPLCFKRVAVTAIEERSFADLWMTEKSEPRKRAARAAAPDNNLRR